MHQPLYLDQTRAFLSQTQPTTFTFPHSTFPQKGLSMQLDLYLNLSNGLRLRRNISWEGNLEPWEALALLLAPMPSCSRRRLDSHNQLKDYVKAQRTFSQLN